VGLNILQVKTVQKKKELIKKMILSNTLEPHGLHLPLATAPLLAMVLQ
jgi:hypothetical protein